MLVAFLLPQQSPYLRRRLGPQASHLLLIVCRRCQRGSSCHSGVCTVCGGGTACTGVLRGLWRLCVRHSWLGVVTVAALCSLGCVWLAALILIGWLAGCMGTPCRRPTLVGCRHGRHGTGNSLTVDEVHVCWVNQPDPTGLHRFDGEIRCFDIDDWFLPSGKHEHQSLINPYRLRASHLGAFKSITVSKSSLSAGGLQLRGCSC